MGLTYMFTYLQCIYIAMKSVEQPPCLIFFCTFYTMNCSNLHATRGYTFHGLLCGLFALA